MHDLRSGSEPSLVERLRMFHVEPDTRFSIFCQQLFVVLDDARMVEGTSARVGQTPYVMDRVRRHIFQQYPGTMSDIFPDEKRTATTTHATISNLKSAIDRFSPCFMEAKAPDSNGSPWPQGDSNQPIG